MARAPRWQVSLGALAIGILISSAATSGAGEPSATEAQTMTCDAALEMVREALEARADMRDEAYTAIMWSRLDAERARSDDDGAACLKHLDVSLRILGLHPHSTSTSP